MRDIISSLEVRKRIIMALFVREAKARFGSQKVGMLWAFFEPLVQVMFFGAMYYFSSRPTPHGTEIYTFMVAGVVPFQLFQKSMIKTKDALKANKTLLAYPIMKPIDTLIARSLLEFVIYSLSFVFLLYTAYHLELISNINSLGSILIGFTLASLMGMSSGIFFAALISVWKSVDKIVPIISRVLFFTSGIFFSMSMLPRAIRDIVSWNPILHITEIVRFGTFKTFPDQYFSTPYVLVFLAITTAMAVVALHLAERSPKAEIRGAS